MSTMKGVAGRKQSIALVRAARALTTTMHRWVFSSLVLMRLRESASCSSEATCMHRVTATAVCSYGVSTRLVLVTAKTARLSATYAMNVQAMRSTEVEGRRSVSVKALSSAFRRSEASSVAAEPGSRSEKVLPDQRHGVAQAATAGLLRGLLYARLLRATTIVRTQHGAEKGRAAVGAIHEDARHLCLVSRRSALDYAARQGAGGGEGHAR
eukprot:scaffold65938_cov54-Phaeocystis_antarctica.AAC.1